MPKILFKPFYEKTETFLFSYFSFIKDKIETNLFFNKNGKTHRKFQEKDKIQTKKIYKTKRKNQHTEIFPELCNEGESNAPGK